MRGRTGEPYLLVEQRKVYITPAYFELETGRDLRTVRDWARKQQVRSFWHHDTLYVHLGDCRRMHEDTPQQERSTKEAS